MRLHIIKVLLVVFVMGLPLSTYAQDELELDYNLSIEEYLSNALPPQDGRMLNFNEVTGILTVTDTPSNQRLIYNLIKQFDVGPKQIVIEAKFVEIEFTDLDELGIEWYFSKSDLFGDSTTWSSGSPTAGSFINERTADAGTGFWLNPDYQGVQWDLTDTDTFPQEAFGWGLIATHEESGDFITAYLKALAQEGRANLLSSPKVTTLSGQMANIQVTRTIPYISDVEFENTGTADHPIWEFEYTIEERITGITLEVTPYVTSGGDVISLDIHPEVSNLVERRPIYVEDTTNPFSIGSSVPENLGWPVVDTRTTQTSVMIESGDTVAMGGFVHDDESLMKKKVPFLGDIPLLGNLFRYEHKTRTKKNLVIFLTATLITSDGDVAER